MLSVIASILLHVMNLPHKHPISLSHSLQSNTPNSPFATSKELSDLVSLVLVSEKSDVEIGWPKALVDADLATCVTEIPHVQSTYK